MKLTMEEWDAQMGHHLEFIKAGAEMVWRHTKALNMRPEFQTMAESQIDDAMTLLVKALATLEMSKDKFKELPGVS